MSEGAKDTSCVWFCFQNSCLWTQYLFTSNEEVRMNQIIPRTRGFIQRSITNLKKCSCRKVLLRLASWLLDGAPLFECFHVAEAYPSSEFFLSAHLLKEIYHRESFSGTCRSPGHRITAVFPACPGTLTAHRRSYLGSHKPRAHQPVSFLLCPPTELQREAAKVWKSGKEATCQASPERIPGPKRRMD